MSLDEASTNDSALIDDDIVASLGFEPTTTLEPIADEVVDVRSDEAQVSLGTSEVDLTDHAPATEPEPDEPELDDPASDLLPEDLVLEAVALEDVVLDDVEFDEVEFAEVEADVIDLDEVGDEPLFGSSDGELLASSLVADDDVELFDVASDDDLGDDVVDLSDDLDVPAELDFVQPLDEVQAAPSAAPQLATLDEVFAAPEIIEAPTAAVATVPAFAEVATGRAAVAGRGRRKLRARKVRRVVRHVDPWSVLTFSVLFHLVFFSSLLLASILVWNGAVRAGTIDNIENFIRDLGDYETFNINSDVVFRAAVVIAGMLTLASSIMVVMLTVVFNLVSDLVGGIRVTVVEEDTVVVPKSE